VSGLCQPHYMLDIPGGHGKSPIGPNYLIESVSARAYWIADYQGRSHNLTHATAGEVIPGENLEAPPESG
jgi:L-lysine 2,3-aminomutase